jgi:hypothetical protein
LLLLYENALRDDDVDDDDGDDDDDGNVNNDDALRYIDVENLQWLCMIFCISDIAIT